MRYLFLICLMIVPVYAQHSPEVTSPFKPYSVTVFELPKPEDPVDVQRHLMVEFYVHFEKYWRILDGCSLSPKIVDLSTCRPGRGTVDYQELATLRKIGLRLLDYREHPKKEKSRKTVLLEHEVSGLPAVPVVSDLPSAGQKH